MVTVEHMLGCVSPMMGIILLCNLWHSMSVACTILPMAKWATDGSTTHSRCCFWIQVQNRTFEIFLFCFCTVISKNQIIFSNQCLELKITLIEFFTFIGKFQPLISTKVQWIYFLFKDLKAIWIIFTVMQHPQTIFYEAEFSLWLIDSGLVKAFTWAAPCFRNVCSLSVSCGWNYLFNLQKPFMTPN